MQCEKVFYEKYKKHASDYTFCPYRISPLGAHVDHQKGKVTGFAIDKGIHMAYTPTNDGEVEIVSLQFNQQALWNVNNVPNVKQSDWADYLRGATFMLSQKQPLSVGLKGVIEGSLPIGGLSSSASVTILFLTTLCKLNGIKLSQLELILMAQAVENKYVGVACGKLDQSCEVYSKKDHLLFLDTKDDTFELIPTNPKMKPYKLAVFFSGIERTLAGSKFNSRVDECKCAAYALKAFAGLEYDELSKTVMRDVPYEVFLKYQDKLPENWRKRAEHWYSEMQRVEEGIKAWRDGDIALFGRYSTESGRSCIDKYQAGSDVLISLYEIMTSTDGVYGGQFSGAGFKGCCMAVIDPAFAESITEEVTKKYVKIYPSLKDKFSVHICESEDGVKIY